MGDAIGQVLSYAIAIALSPVPIIAIVLMLGTPRARTNGPAFVAGWAAGLAVTGTIVLVVAEGANANDAGGPAAWVGWLQIALGALLLVVAGQQWRGRPRAGAEPRFPEWMKSVDAFTPARSAGVAAALAAVNPKNLILIIGAAATIAQTGISSDEQAAALAVFIIVATLGAAVPVAIYFVMGERATAILDELRDWMARHSAAIMTVLCLVIAAKVIGDGISVLSG